MSKFANNNGAGAINVPAFSLEHADADAPGNATVAYANKYAKVLGPYTQGEELPLSDQNLAEHLSEIYPSVSIGDIGDAVSDYVDETVLKGSEEWTTAFGKSPYGVDLGILTRLCAMPCMRNWTR